jgi:ABC-type multidrug transport system ATPase subunit
VLLLLLLLLLVLLLLLLVVPAGLLPPSGGEMLLCGESILTEGGLDRATGLIGVCPQFDVLWGELTGLEHLLVAGHVKGLPWAEVGGMDRSRSTADTELTRPVSQYSVAQQLRTLTL